MRRTHTLCISFLCLLLTTGALRNAEAYSLSGFGGRIGYLSPENSDGTLAAGAHLEFEHPTNSVHLIPSIMYWKVDGLSDLSVNADAYYHFLPEGAVTPYVGAGLGLNVFDHDRLDRSNTELGANLIGGVRAPGQAAHFFMESRITISDVTQFGLFGGITLHR